MLSPQIPRSTKLAWLSLVEQHGWSIDKIVQIWNVPVEEVREVLDFLSMEPIPHRRHVPALPRSKAEAQERRDVIRLLYRQGQSLESLAQQFLYYSHEVLARVVKQPLETAAGKAWARKPPDVLPRPVAQVGPRRCACGCRRAVSGKRKWAREGCRKKATDFAKVKNHPSKLPLESMG
jgi:hypothetical protein